MNPAKKNDEHLLYPRDGKFDRVVMRVEEVFFSIIIISMIIMGLIPIVMRYSGMPGISWSESLSRQMVLWITFLGAGTAIRARASISIDAAPHLFNIRTRLFLRGITEFISAVVCGILIWVSITYVNQYYEFESDTIAFLKIREWWLLLALPAGFLFLTLRLIIASFEDIYHSIRFKSDDQESEEAAE